MSIAYFDCFSGIAGDMTLGALCDAGLPLPYLQRELRKLGIGGYRLRRRRDYRGAIGGTKVIVDIPADDHHHRHYTDIRRLIARSRLGVPVKEMAQAIFLRLARAEGRAHRIPIDRVHFHEVGAIDAIVDIVGAAIGLAYFGFDAIYASPLPLMVSRSNHRGFILSAHGRLPLPPPATLELLKGVPIVRAPVKAELVTPTGAAIITTVAKGFGECPLRTIQTIGYGLGSSDFRAIPNALRLCIGAGAPTIAIEANVDDSSPQIYDYLIDELLNRGAIDVTIRPVVMKKRRPAVCLHVICEESVRERLIQCIFRETTSFGVRYYPIERRMLTREIRTVRTKYGPIRVKCGWAGSHAGNGELVQVSPEYEDCKRLARAKGVPLREIFRLAQEAVRRLVSA